MSLDTVRVSQQGKDQLSKLKRYTGIKQWNILCRWALCTSLADPSVPLVREVITDSNVEMSWRTFGGQHADVYRALVVQRAHSELGSTDDDALLRTLNAHLHRGIGTLAGGSTRPSIEELVRVG